MRLDLFVKLEYQSSTIIWSVSVQYSAHDLLCDVNPCLTRKLATCVTYGK